MNLSDLTITRKNMIGVRGTENVSRAEGRAR